MKYFSVVIVIIGVSLGIVSVTSRNIDSAIPNCIEELKELQRQYDSCAPPPTTFKIFDVIRRVVEYRNQTMNETEFSQSITEYCDTLKSAASCSIEKATIVSPACRVNTRIQLLLNLMRIISRVEAELCSVSIISKIANDKGFSCITEDRWHNCLQNKSPAYQITGNYLEDANVCRSANLLYTCNNEIFDECEHDGFIKKYASQVFNGVVEDFACE